jgi:hypothetical protein
MQIRDGVQPTIVKATLKGLMLGCTDQDERWTQRYNDIDRAVDSVKDESFTNEDATVQGRLDQLSTGVVREIDELVNEEQLSWPPGNMGQLARAVYKYSDYPNRVVSIVTALGLTAGIAGRRFNINGAGLNLYLTLLMHTGEGKSVIDSFISRALNDSNLFGGNYDFMGSRRYTGGKSLMENLDKHRCIISVFTEAGFMFKSKAGDQSGLTRTILDLYGKSGAGESMQSEAYSNEKDSIPAVQSPCFSMINESTPEIFLDTLKGGTETGELTRMNIFRVIAEGHELNRKKVFDLGKLKDKGSLLYIIKNLVAFCSKTQSDDESQPIEVKVVPSMYDFVDRCKEESIRCRDSDDIRANMLSRVGLKSWKVAALCTILDSGITANSTKALKVDESAWLWAQEIAEYELNGLHKFFKSNGDDSLEDVMRDYMITPIAKITRIDPHFYRDPKLQVSKADIKRHGYIFNLSSLRKTLKNCRTLKLMNNAAYGKTGFDIIIKYMIEHRYVKIELVKGISKIRILPNFIEIMEDKYKR